MMMLSYSFVCLFGISFLPFFCCQDCVDGAVVPVYSNISDNATFHMQVNDSHRIYDIEILRSFETTRKRVFAFDVFYWLHNYPLPFDPQYRDRVELSVDQNVTDGIRRFNITLVDVQQSDNGTYVIQSHPRSWNETCFVMYILGKPMIEMSVTPTDIGEGNSGHFMCLVTSTTVPTFHRLSVSISWYVDGQQVITSGRYRVVSNTLSIYSLTRDDDGLGVQCQASEDKGLTTSASMSITMNWGPNQGLDLQPAKTFYHIDVGDTLPNIKCSSDCKPQCTVSWTKVENGSVISTNGLLSLGQATEKNVGEYICTARRAGKYKEASKSIFILLKESKDNVSKPLAAVGFGVSAAALLLAVGLVIFLFRQKMSRPGCSRCHKSTADDSTSQNRAYEDLTGTRAPTRGQETYDALNLDTFDGPAAEDQEARGVGDYENNRIT